MSVRAYRLSDEFLTLYREGNFTLAAYVVVVVMMMTRFTKSKVSFSNIFEEIPIKLHATKLTKALLLELRSTARSSDLQVCSRYKQLCDENSWISMLLALVHHRCSRRRRQA